MHLVEFGDDVVIVVRDHGIDEDGVEEGHTDDTAQNKQDTEVRAYNLRSKSRASIVFRYRIGNFIPAFNRTDLENVFRVLWR